MLYYLVRSQHCQTTDEKNLNINCGKMQLVDIAAVTCDWLLVCCVNSNTTRTYMNTPFMLCSACLELATKNCHQYDNDNDDDDDDDDET